MREGDRNSSFQLTDSSVLISIAGSKMLSIPYSDMVEYFARASNCML